ncbi:MAG: hypothetical protein F6K63_14415 [Moorea sp. SIO1G6]|uniref:hypothetical protein n=1 Tax=Moorena sp. SIO1G6 TaxID=2607840 RepID=UPI0013BF9E42|nr:hypothetical protein [Moorena sp. SIO1G6]NET65509.1 hypothetical protein [Moorena sp. SIO1G6]
MVSPSLTHPTQLFDPMVRYGTDFSNPGFEAENDGESVPNAPYATIPCSLSNHDQSTINNLQSRR